VPRDDHAELPLDPDVADAPEPGRSRPAHARPLLWAVVAAGALVGAPARYLTSLALPTPAHGWPAGTFTVNICGAFLLGWLLEALARTGPDAGWRQVTRLALGTGFCGALTTYSTLAVETDLLVRDHHVVMALSYAVGSVLAGLLATTAGIAVAVAHHRVRGQRRASSRGRTQSAGRPR
jgi:fluoride exporter